MLQLGSHAAQGYKWLVDLWGMYLLTRETSDRSIRNTPGQKHNEHSGEGQEGYCGHGTASHQHVSNLIIIIISYDTQFVQHGAQSSYVKLCARVGRCHPCSTSVGHARGSWTRFQHKT
jgi:hypothetical protein